MSQADIKKVKSSVDKNVGNRVKIRANRGRHKIDITEGVISETYPSIFLVEVENKLDDTVQTVSFSYTDVLTKMFRCSFCKLLMHLGYKGCPINGQLFCSCSVYMPIYNL